MFGGGSDGSEKVSNGEIVTLQLGGGANHLGSHLWNLVLEQQAADGGRAGNSSTQNFNVVLRETKGGHLPRTCCFDLSGTVSTSYGDIEDVSSESALDQHDTWSSDRFQVSLPSAAEDETGASRKEEEHYRGYWDEYLNLSPHLSWRSQLVTCFPGFWHKVNAFDSFGDGIDLFSREDVREAAFDRIRLQAEGCDYLQGFQVLADDLSGFGQVCSEMLLHIRDEVTETKPLVVVGLRESFAQDYVVQMGRSETKQRNIDCINRALATCKLSEVSDVHLVLDTIGTSSQDTKAAVKLYDASALGACLVDSLILGCRLGGDRSAGTLQDVVGSLNPKGGKCSLVSCSADMRPFDAIDSLSLRSLTSMCPTSHLYRQPHSECYIMRGIKKGRRERALSSQAEAQEWFVSQWKAAAEEKGLHDMALCPRAFIVDPSAVPLPFNFPMAGVLDPAVSSAPTSLGASSLASVARFSSSQAMGKDMSRLCSDFKKVCLSPGSPSVNSMLQAWDLGKEECEEILETLETLRGSYDNEFAFYSSDEDDL